MMLFDGGNTEPRASKSTEPKRDYRAGTRYKRCRDPSAEGGGGKDCDRDDESCRQQDHGERLEGHNCQQCSL